MRKTIFWFRRDLRLHDNHGLYKALVDSGNVLPIFIFDTNILDELAKDDARVWFIYQEVAHLKRQLNDIGKDLLVEYGDPRQVWTKLINTQEIRAVYTNHDYEPYANDRDREIRQLLGSSGIPMHTFKDHVIFEKDEIKTAAGGVYTVFTPYKHKWLSLYQERYLDHYSGNKSFYPSEDHLDSFHSTSPSKMIMLRRMGFVEEGIKKIPSRKVPQKVIRQYAERRDYPGLSDSTSRLGIHFRFGTISIREKALRAHRLSEVYLSELIWRDFYAQILANFPHVVDRAFRPKYDRIPWRTSNEDFMGWCAGRTGYPLVDAGMRELSETGYMHNRVRMITASFLTKHLLLDWRWGEAHFADKLLDYDLASNNGGWQWAAGCGTDAAPYFRIFNPTTQLDKYDKDRVYVKKWVPEYGTSDYPDPIVDHKYARERCLATYKSVLSQS